MKAEDTVMDSAERKKIAYNSEGEEDAILNACEAQAEISFKMGIIEMVEWIRDNSFKEEYTRCFDEGVPIIGQRLCIADDERW